VQSRSDGVRRQLARERNLFIAEPASFTHEKYVAIDRVQLVQRFTKRGGKRLRRGGGRVVCQFHRDAPSSIVPNAVERKVPGNPEQPRPASALAGVGYGGPRDAEEDLLGQFPRVLLRDDAAEIAKDAIPVRGEEGVGIGHELTLSNKDTGAGGSSQIRFHWVLVGSAGFVQFCQGEFRVRRRNAPNPAEPPNEPCRTWQNLDEPGSCGGSISAPALSG